MEQPDQKMNKPTQLEFSSSAVDSRSVPKATTYTEIARLLARKRHRSPQEYGADSPATYRYPGSLECLMASRELPKCDEFYASKDVWCVLYAQEGLDWPR
jgi:hypothetical protein